MASHVASDMTHRGGSAVDARTMGHFGYRAGQVVRKRVKGHFGRPSTDGLKRADLHFKLTMTATASRKWPEYWVVQRKELGNDRSWAHAEPLNSHSATPAPWT